MEEFDTGLSIDVDDIHKGFADSAMYEEMKEKAKFEKMTKTKEKVSKAKEPAVTQEELNELLGVPNVVKPKASKATGKKTSKKSTVEERDESKLVDPDKNANQRKQDEMHQNLLMVARRFLNNDRYKDYLKANGFKATDKLEKKSLKDLESYVNHIRYCAGNKRNNKLTNDSIAGVFKVFEAIITKNSKNKMNLTGFSSALFSNEDFLDDLEIFKIEYLSFMNVRYELRMVMTMVQTAFLVHAMNSSPITMKMKPNSANVPSTTNVPNVPSTTNVPTESTVREDNLQVDTPSAASATGTSDTVGTPTKPKVVKSTKTTKTVKSTKTVKPDDTDSPVNPAKPPKSNKPNRQPGEFYSSDDLDKLFE